MSTGGCGPDGAPGQPSGPILGRAPILGKIMVLVTEDWFALSHFQPLLALLARLAREVVVVTRSSGRLAEIEALGARCIDLDYGRSSMHPVHEARTARALARLIRAERPDVVHMIAMKPIVLGSIALRVLAVVPPTFVPRAVMPRAVVHMTGLGFIAISQSLKVRLARSVALAIIAGIVRRPTSWLFCENPDDLAFLVAGGAVHGGRVTILGGAGVDPDAFPAMGPTGNATPVAAFVGRMIRPKGVDVLMEAGRLLRARGVALDIALYGHSDEGNPEAIPQSVLASWGEQKFGRWHGPTRDVAGVWRRCDISVLPARSREGMPRALLEAAAAGRPSIVTDVPGCRHFVRDGVDGLIVPPGDATALAEALARLAADPDLRARLGGAARARFLAGYTTDAVVAALEGSYRRMLERGLQQA